MDSRFGAVAKGFCGALAACLLVGAGIVVWHLWSDHNNLHAAFAVINALASKHPELFR